MMPILPIYFLWYGKGWSTISHMQMVEESIKSKSKSLSILLKVKLLKANF